MDSSIKEPSASSESDNNEEVAPIQLTQPEALTATVPLASSPGPIPDGGLDAWLQVMGGFVVMCATWGLVNTFGVYQTYYQTVMLTSHTASSISWIGSLQACLLFVGGLAAGPLFDAGYFKITLVVGLVLISFSMFMTSLCKTYWQVLLAQGFCIGIGMGLTFLPSAAIIAQYFQKRRAFAVGIGGIGSPIGGIIFPIIFSRLQPKIGFGWATRVIAFIILGLSVVPVIFMRPRMPPSGRTRSLVDKTAFRDFIFMSFAIGATLAFLVLYTAYFYIQVFDELNHLSSFYFAPYTVTLMNVGSVLGRVLPTYLGDKFGVLNSSIACTLGSAVLAFGWMGIQNLAGVVVFTILYGITSGGVVTVSSAAIMNLSPDMSRLGTRLGMAFTLAGIGVLVGTPIAGAIFGHFTRTRWLAGIGYSAGGLVLGSSFMGLSRYAKGKKKDGWKI